MSMRIYGLTGGLGSGKSEAGRRFAHHGIPVIDADKIGHEVLQPGGAAEAAVREAFGQDILTSGTIDRDKLAALVFSDAPARLQLNKIVHPLIARAIAVHCGELAGNGHERVIVEAALLAENGHREEWLDGLVVVLSSREDRLHRLETLRGMPREEAERRMAAQTPPERKTAAADWIIDNSGTLEALHTRVDEVVKALYERQ